MNHNSPKPILDVISCKEKLKKKLKDRKRVKGYCFSYLKYKKEFDSLNAKKLKKKILQDHFSYNEKIKNLIKNFKSIKNDIILIDQRDKENKRVQNQSKLLTDKITMSYNKLYDTIYTLILKFDRKKKNNKYILQKSRINTDNVDYDLEDNLSEKKFNNMIKKFSNNFFNAINKTHFGTDYNSETIRQYKDFFNFIYKRNHSARIINNYKYKRAFNNMNNDDEKKLINQNNNENSDINLSEINPSNNYSKFSNIEQIQKLKSMSNEHINFKNQLIKNIDTDTESNYKEKILKNTSIDLSINNGNKNTNNNHKNNIFLKSFKNINSINKKGYIYNNNINNYNRTESTITPNNNSKFYKKYSVNNFRTFSRSTTLTKTNNKPNNYNTIPIYNNINDLPKKRISSSKVKNMPIYTANIGDYYKNYNRIKSTNKMHLIKRKESHWTTYANIEKDFKIKEDMMMFLLKDKYMSSHFPKKYRMKPDKKKLFVNNLKKKLEFLENPFNKSRKSDFNIE